MINSDNDDGYNPLNDNYNKFFRSASYDESQSKVTNNSFDDNSDYMEDDGELKYNHSCLGNWGFITIFSILQTCEYLVRKANATHYLTNYRVFLNFILIFFCTITFFIIILWKRYQNHSLEQLLNKKHLIWFLVISIFDCTGVYTIIISATYISPPLAVILAQGVIPVSMILSKTWLKRNFSMVHYIGSMLIFLALSLQLFAIKYNPESRSSSPAWGVVFFIKYTYSYWWYIKRSSIIR